MKLTHLQNSFNGGQMAPFLLNRGDLDKFRSSVRQALNFIPTQFGPLRRRPGTVYLGAAKRADRACRLIPFDISSQAGFAIELGHLYIRFWLDGVLVTATGSAWATATAYKAGEVVADNDTGAYWVCLQDHTSNDGGTPASDDGVGDNEPAFGTDHLEYWYLLTNDASGDGIYELPTDYQEDDLFEIQYAQVNDFLYLVHENYPVSQLLRYGSTQWDFREMPFTWPPVREGNLTAITMDPSATSGSITIDSSEAFFDSGHVGSYLVIGYDRQEDEWEVKLDLTSPTSTVSPSIKVRGDYQFRTSGAWTGTITVQESVDGSTWYDVREFVSTNKDANFDIQLTTQNGDLRYVRIEETASGVSTNPCFAYVEALQPVIYGVVKIDAVNSATNVDATVMKTLYAADATTVWNEGAFSDYRGHARSVTLHELRLVFGATATDRGFFWGSQTDDFPNFETGTDDTDAFRYQLTSADHNQIEWISSQKQLLMGSSGGEWVIDSGRDETVITPTNVRARRHSNYGSEYRQAISVDSATMFVRAGGERLSDFSYVFEQDGYQSVDLNLLSYDQTRGGIRQLAYQRKRDPFIWACMNDGTAACVAYNRSQQVTGWTPIQTPGGSGTDKIESVCRVGRSGDEDRIYLLVKRTINSSVIRYVECIDPDAFDKQEDAESYHDVEGYDAGDGTSLEKLCFVDSAIINASKSYDAPSDTTTITGLDHLIGEDVILFLDGSRLGDTHTVDGSGEVAVPGTVSMAVVGLPYTSRVRNLPLFLGLETGSLRGREIQIEDVVVMFYRSGPFTIRGYDDPNSGQEVSVRSTDIAEGDPTPLRTGTYEAGIEHRTSLDPQFVIETSEPLPLTLAGWAVKFTYHGD